MTFPAHQQRAPWKAISPNSLSSSRLVAGVEVASSDFLKLNVTNYSPSEVQLQVPFIFSVSQWLLYKTQKAWRKVSITCFKNDTKNYTQITHFSTNDAFKLQAIRDPPHSPTCRAAWLGLALLYKEWKGLKKTSLGLPGQMPGRAVATGECNPLLQLLLTERLVCLVCDFARTNPATSTMFCLSTGCREREAF